MASESLASSSADAAMGVLVEERKPESDDTDVDQADIEDRLGDSSGGDEDDEARAWR